MEQKKEIMEAKDLRIGNLVSFTDWPAKDVKIKLNRDNLFMENFIEFFCDPIPLTEDWHNRFGSFKDGFNSFRYPLPRKNNRNIVVIFQGDYVMLVQDEDAGFDKDVVSIWNRDLTKRDMYVYEWQNLFKCLTGEELTLRK